MAELPLEAKFALVVGALSLALCVFAAVWTLVVAVLDGE